MAPGPDPVPPAGREGIRSGFATSRHAHLQGLVDPVRDIPAGRCIMTIAPPGSPWWKGSSALPCGTGPERDHNGPVRCGSSRRVPSGRPPRPGRKTVEGGRDVPTTRLLDPGHPVERIQAGSFPEMAGIHQERQVPGPQLASQFGAETVPERPVENRDVWVGRRGSTAFAARAAPSSREEFPNTSKRVR